MDTIHERSGRGDPMKKIQFVADILIVIVLKITLILPVPLIDTEPSAAVLLPSHCSHVCS